MLKDYSYSSPEGPVARKCHTQILSQSAPDLMEYLDAVKKKMQLI